MSNAMDNLKKAYSAMAVKQKTFSFKELFSTSDKNARKYQQEDGSAILPVIGVETKFVPKYYKLDEEGNVTNKGFHTTLTLADGNTTGSFSSALYDFAMFFANVVGLPDGEFAKLDFDAPISVRVVKVPLSEGRTTYNLEPIDGDFTRITEAIGSPAAYTNALTGGRDLMALEGNTSEEAPAAE